MPTPEVSKQNVGEGVAHTQHHRHDGRRIQKYNVFSRGRSTATSSKPLALSDKSERKVGAMHGPIIILF
jgi:hypothetical protein